MAWKLSHSYILKKIKHYFVWTISSYEKIEKKYLGKIDYYFIISGYLLDQKNSFINKLIEESKKLTWEKVFVLWDNLNDYIKKIDEHNITIYSNVSWLKRLEFFSRADIIISRSGYTTVMDLIVNNKKAILFPTNNQTEQEYLAEYLDKKWLFINWWKWDFNLELLIDKLKNK